MKFLFRVIKIISGLFVILILLMFIISFLPMGSGSESYANKWSQNFVSIKNINQATKKYPYLDYKEFETGEWIIGISSNSHHNPWGGTIVTKDSNGIIKSFFGHVCGPAFLQMIFPRATSVDEVYKILSRGFTVYKTDVTKE